MPNTSERLASAWHTPPFVSLHVESQSKNQRAIGFRFSVALVASLVCMHASAATPFSLSCEAPHGQSMEFGVPMHARVKAEEEKRSAPDPSLYTASRDGYHNPINILVEPDRNRVVVTYQETEKDAALRKDAERTHSSYCCSPPAPNIARIIYSDAAQITATAEANSSGFLTYSIYPKLGVVFLSFQGTEIGQKTAYGYLFIAQCAVSH